MNEEESIIIIKNILDNSFNKGNWKQLFSIINISKDHSLLIKYINDLLITQRNNEIILDIIDLIVNNGNNEIIKLIASNEFLISLINILQVENNSNIEIQKKVIYLIQKWAFKFQNSNFKSFNECYIYLKNNGIIFQLMNKLKHIVNILMIMNYKIQMILKIILMILLILMA